MSGSVQRAWTNIITGMDEAAILAECELGEDVAKGVYKAARRERSSFEREDSYSAAISRCKERSAWI